MSIEEFISKCSFSPVTTAVPIPKEVMHFLHSYPELLLKTELWNSVYPPDERSVRDMIKEVALTPRLSTLANGLLINEIVAQMPGDQAYVNVGVWCGYSLFASFPGNHEKCCIGVDNFSQFGGPKDVFLKGFAKHKGGENHLFYESDYKEYFETHTMPIGFYFYDGEHSYENQMKGLEIAEPFLAPGAIIMVDDTNWDDPRRATLDFMAKHPGKYRLITDIKTASDAHISWWNGLMLLRKVA